MGRAEEIIDEGADEDKRGDAASGDSAPKEDVRALPPFEYVTSCVPLNILVLGSDEAGPRAGESANAESADESGPYSVWIEAEPGVIEGLKTGKVRRDGCATLELPEFCYPRRRRHEARHG